MASLHVKRGDEVVVISGAERGKRGKVMGFVANKSRVLVEGVRLIKKAVRKNQSQPEGGIIEKEGSLPISNVMLASRYDSSKRRKASKK
ncbi:MAG: 50S ribosomal protein L24 [Verrucomicrobiae bacterium]|nr:50S ribosomal protein L24 [Verrucomicrobiae bacterium]